MEASILALTIKLEYNRITKEDQIRKKLQKHPIGRRLLSMGLAIPQIVEAINNTAEEATPNSVVSYISIKDQ